MPKVLRLFFFTLLLPISLSATENRIVPLSHWSYHYLTEFQQRGYLHELHATRLPWQFRDIKNALQNIPEEQLRGPEQFWYEQLSNYYLKPETDFGISLDSELRQYNTDRDNLLRPHGDGEILTPAARIGFWYSWQNWMARGGVTTDIAYWQDPDGIDVTHRLLSRTEDYYLAYSSDRISFTFGRFDRHWGLHNRPAALLSDNPRSYDAVTMQFGSERFSVSSIWAQLDNLAADGSFFSRDSFEPGANRRFVSLHRIDWSPLSNLKLSFLEGIIYAGEHTGVELEYMNPFPFWVISQDGDPKNVYANLVIGLMGWWNYQNWTVHAEFMLDDIVVNNRAEAKARNDFKPAAMGIMTNVSKSGILDDFDAGFGFQMISSTAYRSELFMGQWTYAQRGLGSNFSDYLQYEVYLSWHAHKILPGLSVTPYFQYLAQGEGDVRLPQSVTMPNGQNIPLVLSGTVAQHNRIAVKARYQYSDRIWAKADLGITLMHNRYHTTGLKETLPIGSITIGSNLNYRRQN